MAVVLPILLTIVLGIVEFGRAVMVSNVLTSAAREGARLGAIPNTTNSEIQSTVVSRLTSAGIPATTGDISVKVNGASTEASDAHSGDTIAVTASVKVKKVTWLPTSLFLDGDNLLYGFAAMRRE